MGYKMLFTDLDGTFLNSRSEITGINKRAVDDALRAGRPVVLNSGRSWMSLAFFERALGLDAAGCYGVAYNGGMVYKADTKERLLERPMDNALGLAIACELEPFGADVIVYAGDELHALRESPYVREYTRKTMLPAKILNSFSEITGDIIKIIIIAGHSALETIKAHIEPLFAGRCNIFYSSVNLLEFAHPMTDKGRGMAFLAEYLHIPLSEVIAVGDEANDINMLKTAGLGIAVANATDGAKAAADVILKESCDDDAAARIIYDYLLK